MRLGQLYVADFDTVALQLDRIILEEIDQLHGGAIPESRAHATAKLIHCYYAGHRMKIINAQAMRANLLPTPVAAALSDGSG